MGGAGWHTGDSKGAPATWARLTRVVYWGGRGTDLAHGTACHAMWRECRVRENVLKCCEHDGTVSVCVMGYACVCVVRVRRVATTRDQAPCLWLEACGCACNLGGRAVLLCAQSSLVSDAGRVGPRGRRLHRAPLSAVKSVHGGGTNQTAQSACTSTPDRRCQLQKWSRR